MDLNYLLYLQSVRNTTNGILDKFFLYVTNYGEMAYLLPIIAIIYWCINKRTGEFLFLSIAISRLINGFLKITACIYRPWIRNANIKPVKKAFDTATGYSFPSGHTTNAVSTFGSFSIIQDKEYKFLKILLWCLAILVGFSRNYLGVHTPQDVIVGFFFSILSIFITVKLFNILDKNKTADTKIAICGIIISFFVVFYATNKSYPIDYKSLSDTTQSLTQSQTQIQTKTSYLKINDITENIEKNAIVNPKDMVLDLYKNIGYIIGIFLGWIIERKFIKFSTEGTTNQKILRFIVCFFLMQVMLNVLFPILKQSLKNEYSEPMIAFLKTFYILGIAPIIIKIMQNKDAK